MLKGNNRYIEKKGEAKRKDLKDFLIHLKEDILLI